MNVMKVNFIAQRPAWQVAFFFVGVDATARRDIWHLLVKNKAGWFFKLSHIQSSHKYPYLEYPQIFCFGLLTVSFCRFQTLSPRYIRDDKLKTVP